MRSCLLTSLCCFVGSHNVDFLSIYWSWCTGSRLACVFLHRFIRVGRQPTVRPLPLDVCKLLLSRHQSRARPISMLERFLTSGRAGRDMQTYSIKNRRVYFCGNPRSHPL